MRTYLTSMLLVVSLQLFAQQEQKVNSLINKVTVFTRGAQITRTANPAINLGKTVLVFTDISPRIDKQSIQVKGEGAFTILSVAHKINYFKQQVVSDEIALLVKKQAELNDEMNFTNSIINVYRSEQTLIEKNQNIGGANIGVTAENLKAVADFQRARLTEIFTKLLEVNKKVSEISKEQLKVNAQLTTISNNAEKPTAEIHVTVSAKTALTGNFEVTYYVIDAGWFANYDLRIASINKPVEINYKANVYQTSGEDWKNVKLSLSNGNPNESGAAPNLYPWRLHYGAQNINLYEQGNNVNNNISEVRGRVVDNLGEPVPFATVVAKGTTLGTITDLEGNYTLKLSTGSNYLVVSYIGYETLELPINSPIINFSLRQSVSLLQSVVVYKQTFGYFSDDKVGVSNFEKSERKTIALETNFEYKPTTFVYDIVEPYTILNNGKVMAIDIQTHDVKATFEYYAAPKIERVAFLTAQITDWRELNLLVGEANLFFEGAYLGKTILDPTFASDTLQLSLGRDKSVQIQRTKMKEFTQRQFLGGNNVENVAYEIKVRNNKQQPIHIVIKDQFPISAESDIQVNGSTTPTGKIDGDTQIITWELDIPSDAEQKLELKYTVKYPKDKIVVLE